MTFPSLGHVSPSDKPETVKQARAPAERGLPEPSSGGVREGARTQLRAVLGVRNPWAAAATPVEGLAGCCPQATTRQRGQWLCAGTAPSRKGPHRGQEAPTLWKRPRWLRRRRETLPGSTRPGPWPLGCEVSGR